jgi:hypothetical protein
MQQQMAEERSRLNKIAALIGEEERLKNLSQAAEVRRDIEETLGHDVVNQEKLESIAEHIWQTIPHDRRNGFTAEDWQRAIFDRCASALKRAEERLEENRTDDRMFAAKVRVLRQTFAQQVIRAMNTVGAKYQSK